MARAAILLSAVLVVSLAAGAAGAVEQSDTSINHEVVEQATVGETIEVAVTIDGKKLVEEFDRDVDATIVDAEGAITLVRDDRIIAEWNQSSEHTLVYELEVPAAAGEELTITGHVLNVKGGTITQSIVGIAIDGYDVTRYASHGEVVESVGTVHEAYLDALEERTTFQTVQRLWLSFRDETPIKPTGE